MQFAFGSGTMFGYRTDQTVAQPVRFGVLQEGSVEFSGSEKPLHGGYRFPIASASGTSKISGKAKFADINQYAYELYFGDVSTTTGQLMLVDNEIGTVEDVGHTVTVTHAAAFAEDLGVMVASTGVPFVKVASTPATGQYSVSEGVYTFNIADDDIEVAVSYTYTATTGKTMVVSNQMLGAMPTFSMFLNVAYGNTRALIKLHSCTSSKLSFATKLEDWLIPEFDFSANADPAGRVVTMALS